MSDQMVPPPPPPSNVPPPPSGGGFDANAAVDQFKGADPLDLVVVGAGALAFIFSFFSFYSFGGGTVYGYSIPSYSFSAYHGFWGWAGVWLLLAAGVVTALRIVKIAVPNEALIVAGTAVGGAVFEFIALFTYGGAGDKGFSYWIVLVLALASGGISGLKFAKARGLVK